MMLSQKDKEEILLLSAQGYSVKQIMRYFPDADENIVKKLISEAKWSPQKR